jgi:hypothetical protein
VTPVKRQIIDLRAENEPLALIYDAEALYFTTETLPDVKRFTPQHAKPARSLVLWQAPPGQDILQQMLAALRPEQLYLVARPSPYDKLPLFTTRLMGLIKYSLAHYGGRLEIDVLANEMGHRQATIRLALQWLVGQGKLRLIMPANRPGAGWPDSIQREDILVVRPDDRPPTASINDLQPTLLDLLRETAAYRDFVRRANLAAMGLDV